MDAVNHGFSWRTRKRFQSNERIWREEPPSFLCRRFRRAQGNPSRRQNLKEHGATGDRVYLSKVEHILGSNWNDFCAMCKPATRRDDERSGSRGLRPGQPRLRRLMLSRQGLQRSGKLPVVTQIDSTPFSPLQRSLRRPQRQPLISRIPLIVLLESDESVAVFLNAPQPFFQYRLL